MLRKVFVLFFLCIAITIWGAGAAVAEAEGEGDLSWSDTVMTVLENAASLDFGPENMSLTGADGDEIVPDEKFLQLLSAKLRIAYIMNRLAFHGSVWGHDVAAVLRALGESGSVDVKTSPFDLAGYVIYHIILPLQLEPLIRELPVYYRAVVSMEDWEEKFDKILDLGDLNAGKTFYLVGFPKINKEPAYTMPLYVELGDGALSLYEFDSSIEGWLYSFWLRRYHDGSMEIVKKILDWLNSELDEIAGAKG